MGHKPPASSSSSSSSTFRDNGQAPVIPATHHTHMTHLRSVIGLHTCIADRDWLMNLAPALMRRVSVSYLLGRSALNLPSQATRPYFFLIRANTLSGISIVNLTRCSNFSNSFYFWYNTVHVSDGLSIHHHEFKTVWSFHPSS
jgi:hypothetical protein